MSGMRTAIQVPATSSANASQTKAKSLADLNARRSAVAPGSAIKAETAVPAGKQERRSGTHRPRA